MKILQCLILQMLCFCVASWGQQNYPNKVVHLVVPYAAGGYYDSIARVLSPRLVEMLGQTFVVENKVGGSGIIGTDYVAKSSPNGYTLIVGGIGPHSINPSLFPNLPYDPVRDFSPVVLVATSPNILVVHPSSSYRSVKDILNYANAKPGFLNYGSAGSGTSAHLAAVMFELASGTKLNHIPYKGSGPAVLAMVGGETDLLFGTAADVLQQIKAGKLIALAVTSSTRISALGDIPTLAEAGVQNAVAAGWYGIFAPAGTAKEVVNLLNASINKILLMPSVRDQLSVEGTANLQGGSPEFLASFLQVEITKWHEVIQKSGTKAN